MSWNQPLCDNCWNAEQPNRKPFRLIAPDPEQCSNCGESTTSGIWVRLDPKSCKFPHKDRERADDDYLDSILPEHDGTDPDADDNMDEEDKGRTYE